MSEEVTELKIPRTPMLLELEVSARLMQIPLDGIIAAGARYESARWGDPYPMIERDTISDGHRVSRISARTHKILSTLATRYLCTLEQAAVAVAHRLASNEPLARELYAKSFAEDGDSRKISKTK